MVGFSRARALSTSFNEEPERASRPFDKKRDGFVMGEGAGIVILEELETALNRNAKIYGEVLGYGVTAEAHHITQPSSTGKAAMKSMRLALK